MFWKHLAAFAALILVSAPCAAFDDGPTAVRSPGVMFYFSLPLDARIEKENKLAAGMAIQGRRPYETFKIDSRMFDDTRTVNFFGTAIGVKWIVAGVVAAGAVAAVATKDKSTSTSQNQQQAQQASGGGGGTGGGTFHPDGSPHVPGDNCDCHK